MNCGMRDTSFLRNKHELSTNSTDPDWLTKLLYLSCIFEHMKKLNFSLQGESVNILTVNNNIKALKKKIQHWTGRVESGGKYMFSRLSDFLEDNESS